MFRTLPRGNWIPLLALLVWSSLRVRAADDERGVAFFESKIRPVLVTHCFECHSNKAAKVRGGLLLDSKEGLRNGGENGAVLVPGSPEKSLLVKALKHDGMQMPPKKKLPDSVVADFAQWVKMGAPDPRDNVSVSGYKRMSAAEAKTFWSFVAPKKGEAPKVSGDWARSEVDRFIQAKLDEKGLKPQADAEARVLIRRLHFDLIGLPPSPEEIDAFVKDSSPQALEKLVDRLLASKQFGERWGRHWLDLARYAESNGNTDNTPFPHAWRYRDYVIQSFNDDKSYQRFVTEQIAGDLLKVDDAKKDEALIATAFLALTSKPRAQNNPDYRMDLVADQIDVTTRAILGLSVMCARCHDHKFDYLSTKEYYALAGIFDSTQMLFGAAGRGGGGKAAGGAGGLHKLSDGGEAMGVREGRVADCQVCIRGETRNRGARVSRGLLEAFPVSKGEPIPSGSSGRLQLADWLTKSDNPLTARVAVNRIWLHLFGRGLVDTPDNFGYLGEKPTHPELLDWLAVQFMEDGWSHKKAIRRLVLSRVYRLSGDHLVANHKLDPDNRSLWRANTRRLEGEAIRDAMLASSGLLTLEPPRGSATTATTNARGRRPVFSSKDTAHRSVYLSLPRGSNLPEMLGLFDVANPNLVVAQREVTTVPAQALYLMNSPFVLQQARALAKRLGDSPNLDDAGRVDLAYRLTLGRPATSTERERVLKFVREATGKEVGWVGFCQTLYASAEFRYID